MVLPVLRVLVSMTMPRVVVVVVVVIVVLVVLVLACGRDARFFALARRYQTPPAAKASKEGGIFFFGLPFLLLLLPLFDFFVIIFERERKTRDGPVFFLFFFPLFGGGWRRSFCHPQNYYCFELFCFVFFVLREFEKRRRDDEGTPEKVANKSGKRDFGGRTSGTGDERDEECLHYRVRAPTATASLGRSRRRRPRRAKRRSNDDRENNNNNDDDDVIDIARRRTRVKRPMGTHRTDERRCSER